MPAGKFLRGAFVEFVDTGLAPAPNVIVFQFNPDQIVRTWTPASSGRARGNALAVSGSPRESLAFDLKMDAGDMIADGPAVAEGIALASGVSTRLAALEMLLHPTSDVKKTARKLENAVSAVVRSRGKRPVAKKVPASQLPTVLFVWGPGRVLPVRVTSLRITETLYDGKTLNPTHAEASIGLDVLTRDEVAFLTGPLASVASMSHDYSRKLRLALAEANLATSAESAIGLIPF